MAKAMAKRQKIQHKGAKRHKGAKDFDTEPQSYEVVKLREAVSFQPSAVSKGKS
jgi:hypothetical protein